MRKLTALFSLLACHPLFLLAQAPKARITIQADTTTAPPLTFMARGFELRVASPNETQVELTKNADANTPDIVRLAGTHAVAPMLVAELLDSLSAPVMTVRLTGVVVASDRVALSTARTALEQQRISQQEALSQLNSDYQEAQRQLATAEELGKTRVTTRQDLARARDRASDLKQRLDLLRLRQQMLTRQLDATGPVDEVVVLRFDHLQIEARGGRSGADLDVGRFGPPRS